MHAATQSDRVTGRSCLLVDDHPILHDALKFTMESLAPGSKVDLATSYNDTRRMIGGGARYDLVLLDLGLPDCSGFDALEGIKSMRPDLPVVVLSGETDRATILHCLDLGAAGYIPKTSRSDQMRHALRMVASGHVYVPREAITGQLADAPLAAKAGAHGTDPRKLGLTDRQCDVLRLMLRGMPNKLICRELDLAEGTVKVHVSAVLRALGVRNRTQAVVAAARLGLKLSED